LYKRKELFKKMYLYIWAFAYCNYERTSKTGVYKSSLFYKSFMIK